MIKSKICVVGLGYVGLPLAVAFAEKGLKVIGFDINEAKIELYKDGVDPTLEVGSKRLKRVFMEMNFTTDESEISNADYIIVAVPTPVLPNNDPDLRPVIGSSEIVGRNMKIGATVIYESTVYPGATEEECIPVLEKVSGMKCGVDFKIGYSPERINPGDRVHTLEKIVKVVSGMDNESLERIAQLYEMVIEAGVHRAPSIKVAEASKVIENTQRDINIAFMNELSKIFNLMDIDTNEVLDAASTKWNFLRFHPGLVGGHCIGVDPFYLANKAMKLGYNPKLILAAREINDSMGSHVSNILKNKLHGDLTEKTILIMGLTFKEDCPDLRNTKVVDVFNSLKREGINVVVTDPYAGKEESMREYGIELTDIHDVKDVDAIVLAVAHNSYRLMNATDFLKYYKKDKNIMIDVKSILNKEESKEMFDYWRM